MGGSEEEHRYTHVAHMYHGPDAHPALVLDTSQGLAWMDADRLVTWALEAAPIKKELSAHLDRFVGNLYSEAVGPGILSF